MAQTALPIPTAADLRAEIARQRLRLYDLAPKVRVHPARLGALLSGRVPLSPELATRIAAAVETEAAR